MNKLNKLKLVLGCLLILISFIGLIPMTRDRIIINGVANTYSRAYLDTNESPNSRRHLSETNYPIFLGFLFLSGTLLIVSVKNKE